MGMNPNPPDLQKRAVALVPQLVDLIDHNKEFSGDTNLHPAVQLIHEVFSKPDNRIMGAILRAYMEPLILHGLPQDRQKLVENLQDVVAGKIHVSWLRKRTVRDAQRFDKYMLMPKGTYGMHKITQDVLVQRYGAKSGNRLAASIAPLATSQLLPSLVTLKLDFMRTSEAAEALQRELLAMAQDGVNPFSNVSVLEIGGGTEITAMPQTSSFQYKNVTAGGRYATSRDMRYVSLRNPPEGQYDYVMTNNVVSLVVPRHTVSTDGASAANGDLFCTCANLVKAGGKIVHTNSYDQVSSPVLMDTGLHQFAGMQMVEPLTPPGIETENKSWMYRKTGNKHVSAAEYAAWASEHNKFLEWDNTVAGAVERNPRALLSLIRGDLAR